MQSAVQAKQGRGEHNVSTGTVRNYHTAVVAGWLPVCLFASVACKSLLDMKSQINPNMLGLMTAPA
jgi:hypothetical protein